MEKMAAYAEHQHFAKSLCLPNHVLLWRTAIQTWRMQKAKDLCFLKNGKMLSDHKIYEKNTASCSIYGNILEECSADERAEIGLGSGNILCWNNQPTYKKQPEKNPVGLII